MRGTGWSSQKATSPVPGDVLGCLEELSIQVHRVSHNEAWAFCPGHMSRLGRPNAHPNKWSVNTDTGQHSCFSCGFSGSFVYLVMEVLGYDVSEAEDWVRRRGGFERLRRILADSERRSGGLEGDSRVHEWNEARLALFTQPAHSARDKRGVSEGAVKHYGVLWDDKEDCWILPVRDPYTDKLLGYQEKSEQGWVSNKPYGIQKSSTLFGLDCFTGKTAVLLESPLDCLRAYTAGISGCVSSFGAKVSDTQMELLFDLAPTIIIAMDNDDAGILASRKLREKYLRSGYNIKFFNYSGIEQKDIGTDGVTDKQIQNGILSAHSLIAYRNDILR